ncbi:MAG: hypothetical protein U5M23_02950 [Marinagarivorans sp.]|nr:hypothetical protein [Marinagarivorans sp.]
MAHISENIPIRLTGVASFDVIEWLRSEMYQGVLDAVEAQVIAGGGSGVDRR